MEKKLKILLLEDLHSDAVLIDKALQKGNLDFEKLVVDTKESFIKGLQEFCPDIILADHSLPSFNSHEALAVCQKKEIKIPFILITSNMSEEFAVDVIKRGADDYILKDRLVRLPTAIRNSLEKFRLEKERQLFLDTLVKNEKQYRALVENGADALVILDRKGQPTYVSPSIQHVLGYTEEEAMQLNLYAILHRDDRAGVAERMKECLQEPGVAHVGYVNRIKNKDGNWRWLEATITNMLHDPAINGIVANFRDITARHKAEEQLLRSEAFTKGILSSLNSHIAVINQNGKIIAVNKAWDDFAKENGGVFLERTSTGSNYFDVCKKSMDAGDIIAGKVLQGIQSIFKKEEPDFSIEYPCHSTCEQRWFILRVMNFGNDISKVVITHQNITTRKIAEEALEQSEFRYRQMIETMQEGIWSIDENNNTDFVNDKMCTILGYTPNEMIGKTFFDFMDEEGKVSALVNIKKQKQTHLKKFSFKFISKQGKIVWTQISSNPIIGNDNLYKGRLAMVSDITEKLDADQTLRDSEQKYRLQSIQLEVKNKDLRQFGYIVSHNLRAPIAKIQGLVFLINHDKESKGMIPQLLETVAGEVEQLDTVVKDMNGILSVQDTGNKKIEHVSFELKLELIKYVLEKQIKESKAVIEADFQEAETVMTVKSYLYSILFNLLSNAIKYRSPERDLKIEVKTSRKNELICLSVKDNGRGINLTRNRDKIFGLYKRFHGSHIEGRGIGLNLVKTQAESLGGSVEVISTENIGTEFKIYLPVNLPS